MDELDEHGTLLAMLTSVQYAHVKLDDILDLLRDDVEEQEDEADP